MSARALSRCVFHTRSPCIGGVSRYLTSCMHAIKSTMTLISAGCLQEIATRENLVEHGDLLLDSSTESEQVEAMRVPMGAVLDKVC